MAVRAKFKVTAIKVPRHQSDETTIEMEPVYGNGDPNHENTQFWKYTPSGKLELGCVNPEAVKQLELGKEFYIDITPVPQPQN